MDDVGVVTHRSGHKPNVRLEALVARNRGDIVTPPRREVPAVGAGYASVGADEVTGLRRAQ